MADDVTAADEIVPDPAVQIEIARGALSDLVEQERERHPLVIAFVAPLGTPLDTIERSFRDSLRRFDYDVVDIHLSALLDDCVHQPWDGPLPTRGDPSYYQARMDAGDQLRDAVGDGSALAALAVGVISDEREAHDPNTAYLIRSLKHPAEARLLRQVYGDAFSLVGVASTLDERRDNLAEHLRGGDNPLAEAVALISRDEADDSHRAFGQRVRDVYQLADVFLAVGHGLEVGQEVDRFTDCLFGAPFVSPRFDEEGMKLAHDASLRSAAIGRQVGAALIPRIGTPIVIGTNEVAKPGGGQYWTGDIPDLRDFQTGHDPNPMYTNRVVQELLERLSAHGWLAEHLAGLKGHALLDLAAEPDEHGESLLRGARASALIEFTRCMHAEQAAIVNSARSGVSTDGATLFCTTFPCHECAKMIVGAGIVEVYYIEPYPKSLVSALYREYIDTAPPVPVPGDGGLVGGKVPFRPFVGVAPRRYETAFVAGERGAGGILADFDRLTACPRTSGWTSGIDERQNGAVKAIYEVLNALNALAADEPETGATEVVDGGAGPVEAVTPPTVADPLFPEEDTESPGEASNA